MYMSQEWLTKIRNNFAGKTVIIYIYILTLHLVVGPDLYLKVMVVELNVHTAVGFVLRYFTVGVIGA